ncbi:hypothetical protein EJ03DRAFT_71655 [Teratosphaeria nubilosa]|uniref:Uncharacterized protein n=1 Tax=Teratosphaeria nubilosa TaxID=161662 RepID=A0A6G1LLX7_9PEZI|nr:hypothetical protein EJ03DRAFT_71655 [Teratosphaeria nubilosa]
MEFHAMLELEAMIERLEKCHRILSNMLRPGNVSRRTRSGERIMPVLPVNLPCVLFARQLAEAYPDAKIMWSNPPKTCDRWYQSCCETIAAVRDDWTRCAWSLRGMRS